MQFPEPVLNYLQGRAFSHGVDATFVGSRSPLFYRIEALVNLVKGSRVIHVGFADHVPLIEEKRKASLWLHDHLLEAATQCLGVDLAADAVEYCKRQGVPGLFCHDLESDRPLAEIRNSHWDYFVLGEVLEHVNNPVSFLQNIARKYGSNVDRLVVTVPNAFRVTNFKNALQFREVNNSDHRYWFTPYTLAKVLVESGYSIEDFQFVHNPINSRRDVLKQAILKRYAALRDTLLMTARFPA